MKQFACVRIAAAALLAAGLMVLPTAPAQGACVDMATAGGWILNVNDGFVNFGLNAKRQTKDGVTSLKGELNMVDADCHVKGHEVLSYTVVDAFCREIVYDVNITIDGIDILPEWEYIAIVEVCDFGEPGSDDTFSIQVIDVTDPLDPILVEQCSASGTLEGGNVQLHVSGDCP